MKQKEQKNVVNYEDGAEAMLKCCCRCFILSL